MVLLVNSLWAIQGECEGMQRIKDIISVGSADIVGLGISTVFWFYLATLILPSEYGQIHYFISIAAIASTFSLIGQQHTITVYISKNKTVISTLFLASILCSIVSFIVLSLFFDKFDIGLLVIGFVVVLIKQKLPEIPLYE